MREILFRGKAINRDTEREYRTSYQNGDWVYGLVTKLFDERFESLPAEMTNTDGVSGIDIDYETVGQYTGLTDKNGTKIFEGDIIKSKEYGRQQGDKNFSGYDIFEVRFVDGAFVIRNRDRLFYLLRSADKEVVGNIHDNPELLFRCTI